MATILIVDDRPGNRHLTKLLGRAGHRLLEAANGAGALALVRAERPDLVMTDILMPGMDGYEFVRHLRSDPELAATPVIFLSATYSVPEARALAQSCGVEIVLPNPCGLQEVLAAVNQALGVEVSAPDPAAAAKQAGVAAGQLRQIDDTGRQYIKDLQAVKLDFDEVIDHSAKLIAQRDLARGLSKKLSANVDSLQRVMSRMSALIEVGMEMESERDPAKLVELMFAAACDIIDSKYAAVGLLDEQERMLRHVYAKGIEPDVIQAGDHGRAGLLGSLLSGRRAIRVRGPGPEAGVAGLPPEHPPVSSVLAVTIASANRVYGWIYFADKTGSTEFSVEDERLANVMATKLALLYENLGFYDVIQRHTAKLQVEAGERKRAQGALREREAGLRRAQEMARLAHVITGPDGSFESWSDTLPQLIGVDPAAMLHSTREWLEIVHPDDRAMFRAKSIEARATGAHDGVEYRLRHSGGAWLNIRQAIEPLEGRPDPAGNRRWFNTIQDVTEQKQVDQELRRFRLAIDMSMDSVYLTDPVAMRFVYVNDVACRRLGYPREQLLQMGPQEILAREREDLAREFDELIAAGEHGMRSESSFVRSDGSQGWTEMHRRAIPTDSGWLIVTIGRDITERKLADERIRRLNRVYAVLSGINSAIVRISNREELFKEACRIAVSEGGFVVARVIGLDENGKAHIAATTETDSARFLDVVAEFNRDPDAAQSLLAQALRSGQPMVSNDLSTDLRVQNRAELTREGTYALALLPLTVGKRVVGSFILRAKDAGMFDDEELRLLLEMASDMSFALEHIAKEERLNYLAMYDPLTGLANRTLFLERLDQFIQAASPVGNKIALVLADIERFRTINDSLGRQAGDALINQIAERLVGEVGKAELARIGTDQFMIVLQAIKGKSEVSRSIERLWQRCFAEPFRVSGAELRISARAGVTLFPNDGADAELLLRNVDAALVKAKELGERYVFYTPALTARTGERLTLENRLRQALEKDEFVLHYQPKVDSATRSIVGAEALIRWESRELGLVPPGKFIPLMEETGLILDVGSWALQQAVADHLQWTKRGLVAPRVAVNVSAIQLRRRDFFSTVEDALGRGAVPPGIDLEITESLIMEDIQDNIEKLKAVRNLGVSIAIDDFGTGYSSLGYLAKLPVQTLKIDRSFVITMLKDSDTMTLVQAIISLAHALRLKVVAEGVDEEEQARMLHVLRCDEMQGYLFSKPVPFEEMTALLKERAKP